MSKVTSVVAAVILLAGLSGCSLIFYPRASEFLEKAKGPTGVDTMLNLTAMLDVSVKAARGGQGYMMPVSMISTISSTPLTMPSVR